MPLNLFSKVYLNKFRFNVMSKIIKITLILAKFGADLTKYLASKVTIKPYEQWSHFLAYSVLIE